MRTRGVGVWKDGRACARNGGTARFTRKLSRAGGGGGGGGRSPEIEAYGDGRPAVEER